jgi:hypothetical protein
LNPGLITTLPVAVPTHHSLKDLDLFAVLALDHVADEYPAVDTGVGALVLAVVILGRWVRVGCARLIHVNLLSRLAGSRGAPTPAGPFLWALPFTPRIIPSTIPSVED